MEESIPISFAEAVRELILDVYDNECHKMLDEASKDLLTELQFEEFAAPVLEQFMSQMYTFERQKFQELFKPIKEEYEKFKAIEDANRQRSTLRLVKK